MKHLYFHDFLEFWEDDEEIRMEDERARFFLLMLLSAYPATSLSI